MFIDFRLEVHKINNVEGSSNSYFNKNFENKNDQFCDKEECAETKNNVGVISDDDEDEAKVFSCETLRMCIITTLNWGLRNGGGIGDVLRNVDPQV